MDKTKKTIEAALFISGRWMGVEDLARVAGSASVGSVKEALGELQKEYEERDGGVRLTEAGGKYRLEISPEVRERVYYLAPEPELSPALIKTLALIAYKQPVYQSKVAEVIGNRAYDYIKELRKKEFIKVKKKGRTKLLSTTGKFRKYFALEEGVPFKPELESEALQEAQKKLDEVMDESEEELEEAEEALDELEEEEKEAEEEAVAEKAEGEKIEKAIESEDAQAEEEEADEKMRPEER